MKIEDVKDRVMQCTNCELYKSKKNYVFGEGDTSAKIMFIGEAPGFNEDESGRPFVGRAGKIFDELLASVNLKRGDIYICNILKCRPPNNRDPTPTEIAACTPYLTAQIDLIKPKVICTLGNYATKFVMRKFNLKDKLESISRVHGKVFKSVDLYGTTEIIPFYHPAVATYTPEMKDVLLKDFKLLEERK